MKNHLGQGQETIEAVAAIEDEEESNLKQEE